MSNFGYNIRELDVSSILKKYMILNNKLIGHTSEC